MRRLALVLCSPRTGSSLVAQILWRHGCWLPEDDTGKVNQHGYTSYENQAIKEVARRQWFDYHATRTKQFGVMMQPNARHCEAVAAVVRATVPYGTWLHKTAVEFYPLFIQFDPRIVLIRRNEDTAVESMAAKQRKSVQRADPDEIRAIHRRRMALMAGLEQEHGAVWVDTDALIAGEYDDIRAAVEYCGLVYDQGQVDRSIDRGKWRFVA